MWVKSPHMFRKFTMISDITTIGLGILGGIIGGIIVNIVSIIFQKKIDNKDEEKKSKIEEKNMILSKLDEIIDTWDKELSKNNIDLHDIQYRFGIFSSELTTIISNSSNDLPKSLKHQLQSLSTSLSIIKDFRLASGPDYVKLKYVCLETIKCAKTIKTDEF